MRLHAFLLLASLAIAARAATIPEPLNEKKLPEVVPEDSDKVQNTSSEQELIDQANTIQDVENQLRVKPEPIPVEVLVEKVEPTLKVTNADDKEEEEIVRPAPDLRNPGLPQRQEHETQNPASDAVEQQNVLNFKQTINDAGPILKQGFDGVSETIKNIMENNAQIKYIQQNVQTLRDGFLEQIDKLNGTVYSYFNPDNTENAPQTDEIKNNYMNIESSLNTLKNNFINGLNMYVESAAVGTVRAEEGASENKPQEASSTVAPGIGGAPFNLTTMLQNIQLQMQSFQQSLVSAFRPGAQANNSTQTQSDTQASTTSRPGLFQPLQDAVNNIGQAGGIGSGSGPFAQAINNFSNQVSQMFGNLFTPAQAAQQPAKPAESGEKPSESKPDESKPEQAYSDKPQEPAAADKPAAQPAAQPAPAVLPNGPIRQILQNNPISKGIANAVQRLQNNNKPTADTPRETVKNEDNAPEPSEPMKVDKKPTPDMETKGHKPGNGGGVYAWSVFISSLIGSIGAVVNGSTTLVSQAVNSAINTIGTNVQGIITTTATAAAG